MDPSSPSPALSVALAVLAVLFFHLEFDGFGGGFLGVSLFFTLSGFLITQLILREFENTGRLSLTRFWVIRSWISSSPILVQVTA